MHIIWGLRISYHGDNFEVVMVVMVVVGNMGSNPQFCSIEAW